MNGRPDWAAVRDQKDALVTELRQAKYADVLAAYPAITLVQGRATLAEGPALTLADGRTLTAPRLVLATGASPWSAPIPGLADAAPLDSTSVMARDALPASLAVIGGSAVGLELAQMFARLGVAVTVLEALPTVVPGEDPAVGAALAAYLAAEGLRVEAGVAITSVARAASGVRIPFSRDGTADQVVAEEVLVATGRRANTAGLGLEAAGVALGRKGEVVVDDQLRTSLPGVFAAGDVTGDPMFVYVAAYAGAVASENALTDAGRRYDLTALPRVTFTDPAVASVGLTEAQARDQGLTPLVSRLALSHVPRALAARDTRGFIQLVADAQSRKIIGAQILAAEAGELVTEPALAIRFGLTIDDLTRAFHPYLTLSEGIKLAAQTFTRDVATLSCCAA